MYRFYLSPSQKKNKLKGGQNRPEIPTVAVNHFQMMRNVSKICEGVCEHVYGFFSPCQCVSALA